MATADSVKAKIQGLIDAANGATGGNATDLTGAVNALISGFGQGGGIGYCTIEKICRIDVAEPVAAIKISVDAAKGYDFVLIDPKGLTAQSVDWLYLSANEISTSNAPYSALTDTYGENHRFVVSTNGKSCPILTTGIISPPPIECFYAHLYTAGNVFVSGGVTAYGGYWHEED